MSITLTTSGAAYGIKTSLFALGVIFGMAGFAHCSSGCAEFGKPQDPTEAERNYTTEIIACAATAGYPGAYDHTADLRCRKGVDCRYGLGPCQ